MKRIEYQSYVEKVVDSMNAFGLEKKDSRAILIRAYNTFKVAKGEKAILKKKR